MRPTPSHIGMTLIRVFIAGLLLSGCGNPTNSNQPTAGATGVISGTVATRATDITVEAQRPDGSSRVVRAAPSGKYTIEGLTPGSYRLFATARGYSRSALDVPVDVAANQTIVVKDIVLNWTGIGVPTGTLTGVVSDAQTGSPVEGSYVQVVCNPREIICLGRAAYTDANGRYTIPSIPPGYFFDLHVAKDGYPERYIHGQVIGEDQTQTLHVIIETQGDR